MKHPLWIDRLPGVGNDARPVISPMLDCISGQVAMSLVPTPATMARSSKVEQGSDKAETVERYHPCQPIHTCASSNGKISGSNPEDVGSIPTARAMVPSFIQEDTRLITGRGWGRAIRDYHMLTSDSGDSTSFVMRYSTPWVRVPPLAPQFLWLWGGPPNKVQAIAKDKARSG